MTREQLHAEALAYHESAHYCAARQLGLSPESCRVDATGGVTRYAPRRGERATPAGRRRLLSVLFAGRLGELLRFGWSPLEDGRSSDDRAANALLEPYPQHQRIRMQSQAMDAAADALRARWPLVEAIAEELLRCGRFPRATR
jgi:hypothetical protein